MNISFYCMECRHYVVIDEARAGLVLQCPSCGKNITVPPRPVWLPAINDALRKIVQEMLAGKLDSATARLNLQNAIIAAGYHPGTALVEEDSPADLLCGDRRDLILDTNVAVAHGYCQFTGHQDPDVIDALPALEFYRRGARRVQRDWLVRWNDAGGTLYDGRMIAKKDDDVWQNLGDGAGGYKDTLGNPFPPFAVGSGMRTRNVDWKDALALGVIQKGDTIKARHVSPTCRPPAFIPIEDERVTEYLWNTPERPFSFSARLVPWLVPPRFQNVNDHTTASGDTVVKNLPPIYARIPHARLGCAASATANHG